MATPVVNVGTGSTIVFGTSAWAAKVTKISIDGIELAELDITNLSNPAAGAGEIGGRTFMLGDLADPGSITIEGHFNPDLIPPIRGVAETVTLTFPVSAGAPTAATYVFSGATKSFQVGVPLEELMTFTMTVKVLGLITVTVGA